MKRILTGAVLAVVFTWVITGAPYWLFLVVLLAVACFCYYEFTGIVAAHGIRRPGPIGYAAGIVLVMAPPDIAIVTIMTLVFLAMALRVSDLRGALPCAAATLLGVVYIFGAWRLAIAIRMIDPAWLLFALAINWLGDTAAYYTGRTLGRHRLAPVISPGKTWEGSIGSVAASVLFGVLYLGYFAPSVGTVEAVLLSAAANVAGQFGDLAESALKRGGGLKDSGTILPGHGGALDRVDSSLFSVPVVYVLMVQLGIRQ